MHLAVYSTVLSSDDIRNNFIQTEPYTNVYWPPLLYYKFAEYSEFVELENGGGTSFASFIYTNSSLLGGTGTSGTSKVDAKNWVPNPSGTADTTFHSHGDNTYIDTGDATHFNFLAEPFTVNLWISPDNQGQVLMGNGALNSDNVYSLSGGGWCIRMDGAHITLANDSEAAMTSGTVTIAGTGYQEWVMVTFVRTDETHVNIYLNGVLDTSVDTFGLISSSDNTFQLCPITSIDSSGNPHNYDGDLWDVQIWDQALTPVDVANLYFNQRNGDNWP